MYRIEFVQEHDHPPFDEDRLRAAIEIVLREAAIERATISVAIVDDARIHEVNRQYLQHDYPTDVISFVLEQDAGTLDGEIVASADTAASTARRLDWPMADELLLYVVHGCLHLAGHDDLDPASLAEMRRREREVLAKLGVVARYEEEK